MLYISTNSQVVITGANFYSNYAYLTAGVIYMETGSYATITDT